MTSPISTSNPNTTDKPHSPRKSHDHVKPLSETDPKAAKQKSAEDKLQLLGTFQAMKNGKMPHNAQLEELLEKLVTNKVIKSREHLMSQDGRILLNDFRKLINTVKKSLSVKNKEELFQSLVYHLHQMESPVNKEQLGQHVKGTTDKQTANSEGKKAADALLKIGKLILLNNEFRSVLGEVIDISQDIFSSVANKAGDSITNAGQNMQDGENHPDKSGKRLVDKYLDKALDPNRRTTESQPLSGEHGINTHHDHSEPRLISSPQDDPRHQGLLNTGDSVHPNAIPGDFPAAHAGQHNPLVQQHNQIGQQPGLDQQVAHQGTDALNKDNLNRDNLQATGENVQNKIESNPKYQKAKEQMYAHKDHAHATFKENVPKERQDDLIRRLKATVAQVQQHPDYQNAIETLVDLIKVWSSRLTEVANNVKTSAKEGDHPKQEDVRVSAEREFKALVEAWAQGNSIDPLLHGVQDVMNDAKNDEHLREFYHTVVQYIDKLAREPGYAQEDRSTEDGKRLFDRGNEIVKGRYREHLNNLSFESRKLMNYMAEDEMSKELNHRVATIHRDLWMDAEGNPAFKPQLLNDMRMTLLPAFIDEIKYIPIPRIEYSDPQYDIVIENLILSGDTLLPNVFESKAEAFNSFSLRSEVQTKPSSQSIYIRMSEIQAEIDDVVFFYKKKSGFPKLSDHGVASLNVGGKGITVTLRVHSVSDNPAMTFKVAHCKVNVDNLKVKINDSKHDMLYKAIAPLMTGVIRKQIAKALEQKITDLISQADQKVTQNIVQMNQNLQKKAYEALPEEEKAKHKEPQLSQARSRPGLFGTLVQIINSNIKTKVQKRNEAKRMERDGSSSIRSSSVGSKTEVEGQDRHNRHSGLFGGNTQRHSIHDNNGLSTQGHAGLNTHDHSLNTQGHSGLNTGLDNTQGHANTQGGFNALGSAGLNSNTNSSTPIADQHRSQQSPYAGNQQQNFGINDQPQNTTHHNFPGQQNTNHPGAVLHNLPADQTVGTDGYASSNNASMETDRHHVVSPPLSPQQKVDNKFGTAEHQQHTFGQSQI